MTSTEAGTDTDAPEVSGHFTRESLGLSHSLGYDCSRRNNLHVLDARTLLYASGNLLHFLDIETGDLRFLRTGGGVTALQVDHYLSIMLKASVSVSMYE